MEKNGLKVNTQKTEIVVCSRHKRKATVVDSEGEELKQVEASKHLGVTLCETRGSELVVRARLKAAWNKWREISGVTADKRIPRKLKVKIYKTIVRPAPMHGAEVCEMRKKEAKMLETASTFSKGVAFFRDAFYSKFGHENKIVLIPKL